MFSRFESGARARRSIDAGQGDRSMALHLVGPGHLSSVPFLLRVEAKAILHIAVMYRLPNVRGASRYVTPGPLAANKIIVGK